MQSRQRRPIVEELEELYAIAVQEHGRSGRSALLIADALRRAGLSHHRPADQLRAAAQPRATPVS